MNGYTREELTALDRVAREWFGCRFIDLDYERQDEVYCYAADNGEV